MFTQATRLKKAGAIAMSVLCVLGAFTNGAAAQQGSYESQATAALNWMKTQQQPDGSFAGFGAGSTVDAVLAIIAAGQSPASFSNGGNTPISFLESKVADLTKTPGSAGKLLIVAATLNGNSTFGGTDLVGIINGSYDPATGHYGQDALGHAFAMLGLHAAGQQVPAATLEYLKGTQTPEGGWAFSGDTAAGASDTNTTAVVLQALTAVGATKTEPDVLNKAIAYLGSQQNADGGFPYQKVGGPDSESDGNSTAYVAQALLTTGNTQMAAEALTFVASLQKPNGAFQWKQSEPDDNAGATYQAVPALLGASLVFPRPSLATDPTAIDRPVPGMPTTGSPIDELLGALAGISALALGVGVLARRKATAR
ncbi:MAG TPA: prenyltransferase/squalene oxidase repeat-containing protein [Chloroflexia bacterium]